MFGMLSYDRDGQEPIFEADTTFPNSILSTDSSRRGTTTHKACELCRARKLRCSGDPSGCDRCKASSNACKYPPGTFRSGRKRTRSHGLLAGQSTTINSDVCEGRDFSQLEGHNAPGSAGIEEDTRPLSTHELLETEYGLSSHMTDDFLGDSYGFNNSAEYSFSDHFEAPWQDSQAFRTKTTPCDFSTAGPLLGREWSETTVDTTRELSSGPSVSRSNSVETIRTYAGKGETKLHTEGNYCQCLGLVARLLEQVETQGARSDASIDGLLESCREPLRQRKMLLACPHCKSRSECILLLAMLAKSLSAVCNGLVQRYVQGRLEGSHKQLVGANEWPEVRIGAYFIEDSADRSTVVEALIVAKLNSLHDFLIDLKARAKRREGHLAFLLHVEERVKYLKTLMPHFN